jgi:tRNA (mo5U34)-methyltransferase
MATTDLDERVRKQSWYHTIALAPGLMTEGWFDLRPYLDRYGLPERMDGMRALDVGTWDGFWAFEMERRGAEVVALDIDDERELDWPPRRRPGTFPPPDRRGSGFRLAREILDSSVERVPCSIYDATPERLGRFDLVFCGTVLVHLRDQLLALERIAALCRDIFISAEAYDRPSGLVPFSVARYHANREASVVFWMPSARTWRHMIWTAGFDQVTRKGTFVMRSRDGIRVPHVIHHASKAVSASSSV